MKKTYWCLNVLHLITIIVAGVLARFLGSNRTISFVCGTLVIVLTTISLLCLAVWQFKKMYFCLFSPAVFALIDFLFFIDGTSENVASDKTTTLWIVSISATGVAFLLVSISKLLKKEKERRSWKYKIASSAVLLLVLFATCFEMVSFFDYAFSSYAPSVVEATISGEGEYYSGGKTTGSRLVKYNISYETASSGEVRYDSVLIEDEYLLEEGDTIFIRYYRGRASTNYKVLYGYGALSK